MSSNTRHIAPWPWLVVAIWVAPVAASAATIEVYAEDSAEDNMAKIEGAGPGDEVVIAPGTYSFRLYLEGEGSEVAPIVIRAADPGDRPVWDLSGDLTANFPGTYGSGDAGRAIWQVTGSHYYISAIEFRGGTDGVGDGGGLRLKSSDHVTIVDCLFEDNDNGLQGAGTNTLVEYCEFGFNGFAEASEGCHNLYIHGGDITVRYCYIHDAQRSQNMHIRANQSVFEYNWITRSRSYMGDMMPCTVEPCYTVHTMLLRGNVFLRGTPTNDGQVFVMYNDQLDPDVEFHLTMEYNTIIGNGDAAALVHVANEDPAINAMQTAELNNNVVVDLARIFRIDDEALTNYALSGSTNWITDGTADIEPLIQTLSGTDPGFRAAAVLDFVPEAGSPLIGAADPSLGEVPDREYFRDENLAMQWRWRLSAEDVGAFESTTDGDGYGPYDEPDDPWSDDDDASDDDDVADDDDVYADDDGSAGSGEGCDCQLVGASKGHVWSALMLGLIVFVLRRVRVTAPR